MTEFEVQVVDKLKGIEHAIEFVGIAVIVMVILVIICGVGTKRAG